MSKGFWMFMSLLFFTLFISMGSYIYISDLILRENDKVASAEAQDLSKCVETFSNNFGGEK